jgi:hypothetical protein
MKNLMLLAACAMLALSACAYSSDVVASPREARYCSKQGFNPGTEAFDNCVLNIREAWAQKSKIKMMAPAS